MKIALNRQGMERKGLAVTLLIVLPLVGVLFSRLIYEFIQGIWWYDTSTQRTILSTIGVAIGIILIIFMQPLRRVRLSIFDLLIFTYGLVWVFSLLKGLYSYGLDTYVLKQVFTFGTMIVAYLYGKSWIGSSRLQYLPLVILVVFDSLITLLGVYPNVFPLFIAAVFLALFISIIERKYFFAIILALPLVLAITDINRTLMLWMFLVLISSIRLWANQLPKIMVLIACLVAISPLLIEQKDTFEKSKTEVRIEQVKRMIGLAPATYDVDIATMDRKLEAWAVEDKFKAASLGDKLFGFGAGAKYDVKLNRKVILNNSNVHMGPWYELLNRGIVGISLLLLIFIWSLFLLYRFKEHKLEGDNHLKWMLAWLFILSVIFWITWSNFVYTFTIFWFYLGRLSNLAKNLEVRSQ